MNKKQFLKDYLSFSKKERIGIYCILAVVLIFYFCPFFFANTQPANSVISDTALAQLLDTIQKQKEQKPYSTDENTYAYEPIKESGFTKGAIFEFDPNLLAAEGWKQLGLKERTIKTIINYRNKGGKFYKPEDLQKIWGLPAGFYDHVSRHIRITSIEQKKSNNPYTAGSMYEKKERRINSIDINQADTSAFIALPGIGSKLAARIVNFREKLGGFHSVEQIKETYGLADSSFQQLKPYLQLHKTEVIKRFNINTASKDELKSHPYIRWQLANAIVEYRNQHGPFKNLTDIKNIHLIDETYYFKLAPYLSLK